MPTGIAASPTDAQIFASAVRRIGRLRASRAPVGCLEVPQVAVGEINQRRDSGPNWYFLPVNQAFNPAATPHCK